jgi:hypothetical protein
MDTNKKQESAASDAANKPIKVYRLGDVSASVFANPRELDGRKVVFHSVTISRSYKDGDEYKRTNSFNDYGDIMKVIAVSKLAADHLLKLQYEEAAARE